MQTSIGVILIVVSCYMIGEIYKVIVKKEKYKKLIPIVLAITGAIMGGLIYKSDKSLLFLKFDLQIFSFHYSFSFSPLINICFII